MGGSWSDAIVIRLCERLQLGDPEAWDLDISDDFQIHTFQIEDDTYTLSIDVGDFEYSLSKNDIEIESGNLELVPVSKIKKVEE